MAIMTIDDGSAGYVLSPGGSDGGEVAFRGLEGRGVRALAHGAVTNRFLTQDERFLYWTEQNQGTVTRLPKDGGIPLVLATGQNRPAAICKAGAWLYWVNTGTSRGASVVRMPAEGGEVELLSAEQDGPLAVAVHGDTVVWTTIGDGLATGTVKMKALGGGPVVTLATGQKQPLHVAIDDRQVYWSSQGLKRPTYFKDGSILRMPRGGKKRYVVAKNQPVAGSLVTDETSIYWMVATTYDEPHRPGRLLTRRKEGGKIRRLASWNWYETGPVAVDATHVYWMSVMRPALFRVPKDGGPTEQLMRCEARSLFTESLIVDERCVYWTAMDAAKAGGAIFKMAK